MKVSHEWPQLQLQYGWPSGSQLHFGRNKERVPVYYELLIDNEKGQLLMVNRKAILDGRKSLAANGASLIFELENTYYYYGKKNEKMMKIKSNGSNLDKLPDLSDTQKNDFRTNGLDMTQEQSLIDFFQVYFGKKGF